MKSSGYAYVLLEEGARVIFLQGGPKFEVTPLATSVDRIRLLPLRFISHVSACAGQLGAADSAMPNRRGQLGVGPTRHRRFGAGT